MPERPAPGGATQSPARGRYYLDDGPGENAPADLDGIADAAPRLEPLHRGASRPYVVMGKAYTPMTALAPYKARGIATWYGRRYHGRPTSSGEPYDMYGMTAAHPVLPIPSYVRVTNVANGRTVVLRVNDRGPFLNDRLIDLSYTAAYKLGILNGGSALVEVESVLPGAAQPAATVASAPAVSRLSSAETVTPSSASAEMAPDSRVAASAAPPAQNASAATGLYLQLGAFGSRDNAQSYLERLRASIDWLADRLQVLARDGYYRVHAGPYASPGEARDIADRLTAVLGLKPLLVDR
jgi:rare lipoprotein A